MTSYKESRWAGKVEFQSILRLSPLQRNEQDEPIILEPLECGTSVVLHPPVASSSPSTVGNAPISGNDTEFRFDKVIESHFTPESVYNVVGQPIALQAMKRLKDTSKTTNLSKNRCHLVVNMKLEKAERSVASSIPLLQTKQNTDDILPYVLDSLYIQSKHQINHNKDKVFNVNMTILLIKQSKTHPADVQIYDLLQHSTNKDKQAEDRTTGSSASNKRNGSTQSIKSFAKVTIQQSAQTGDCELTNVTPQICNSLDMARDKLQLARKFERRLSNMKYFQHMFISLQPLLMSSRSGKVVLRGDNITVLETQFDSNYQIPTLRRNGDAGRVGAHKAILNCLQAMYSNRNDENAESRKVPYAQHELTMLLQPLFSCQDDSVSVYFMLTISPTKRNYEAKKLLLSEYQNFIHASKVFKQTRRNVNSHKTTKPFRSQGGINRSSCDITELINDTGFDIPCNKKSDDCNIRLRPSIDLSAVTSDSSINPLLPPVESFCSLGTAPVDEFILPMTEPQRKTIVNDFDSNVFGKYKTSKATTVICGEKSFQEQNLLEILQRNKRKDWAQYESERICGNINSNNKIETLNRRNDTESTATNMHLESKKSVQSGSAIEKSLTKRISLNDKATTDPNSKDLCSLDSIIGVASTEDIKVNHHSKFKTSDVSHDPLFSYMEMLNSRY